MCKQVLSLTILALLVCQMAQAQRWEIDGKPHSITWNVGIGDNPSASKPHDDHLEMSGQQVSAVLRYGVDADGNWHIEKSMVWPMLRTIPNNTHASLMRRFDCDALKSILIDGRPLRETVEKVTLNGTLEVQSKVTTRYRDHEMQLRRVYFPSPKSPALIELYEFENTGKGSITIEWPATQSCWTTPEKDGVDGSYDLRYCSEQAKTVVLKPGNTASFQATLSAGRHGDEPLKADAEEELKARKSLVDEWTSNLVFQSPDPVLNTMQSFSKIRAMESIYETKSGPMHGPGGESYYAAIWANDQAEYINPYFPFVGYDYGNKSALHAYRLFAKFMNDGYKAIPSSIIAEGDDIWNGAGDRGDAAMIAYGAARYVLAKGDRKEAEELWPLIEWCLEYCRRQLNEQGVPRSDSDELEGRFPSGEANLCTASLYYDALVSAASLCKELGIKGKTYRKEADVLRRNIEQYFGHEVEGFDTYRYYEGNNVLRAWICIPLTMGIYDRADGTADALFSPRLWTENGLLSQAGDRTFWDRSTLYALRGVIAAGKTGRALPFLRRYSATRLLGEHVPYAVEAWPEGGQRHLSAESALYGRIYTEGLFGLRPTGLRSFDLTPRLPEEWPYMELNHIRAFGHDFDIRVERGSKQGQMTVTISEKGRAVKRKTIGEGVTMACRL